MHPITYIKPGLANMGNWQGRHLTAIRVPTATERPIVDLISAWTCYAIQHQARYDDSIGGDGVLGPQWAALGAAIRGLLDGETGRLDCGSLDAILCDNLTEAGFNPDDL